MLPAEITTDRASLEDYSRRHWQTARLDKDTVLCRVLGKYLFYADAADRSLTPHLCLNGCWEPWITLALARLLRPGMHCLDVGANHGYYTLLMSDAVAHSGRVLALEPHPRLAQLLEDTLEVNGLQHRVEVIRKAAADRTADSVQLVIPQGRTACGTIMGTAAEHDAMIEVATESLDSLTAAWPQVDLVKIDVEGAEEAVWRGMEKTLARNPAIKILLEFDSIRYRDPGAFIQAIQTVGFRLRYIDFAGGFQQIAARDLLAREAGADWWMLFLSREE